MCGFLTSKVQPKTEKAKGRVNGTLVDGLSATGAEMNADVSAPPCPIGHRRATHTYFQNISAHETIKPKILAIIIDFSGGLAADPEVKTQEK